jgi:cobalt-precorrin-5B (C1)-methyltransferase
MEILRNINGKLLRCGYTTGSCATAAAKAAAISIFEGVPAVCATIETPNGISLTLEVCDAEISGDCAACAVKKYSGDDPDVTNGALICAKVKKIPAGIIIEGGSGVGRVTKPGLDQPVGAAAINSVPRATITKAIFETAEKYGYGGGFSVTLSVPGGEELAKRTFNPRLGIEGGISIIGTTGIVEPMSSRAIIDTTRLFLSQLKKSQLQKSQLKKTSRVALCLGNYGEKFARNTLGIPAGFIVSCSNFIGDAIDAAAELGFKKILLIGHIGKLVKLGVGITNVHSNLGDARIETLLACALEAGADLAALKKISRSVTCDAALDTIENAQVLEKTLAILGERINLCLTRRAPPETSIGYICFTNAPAPRVLTKSSNAEKLLDFINN